MLPDGVHDSRQPSLLAPGNRCPIYERSVHSAGKKLCEELADEQAFEAARAMVLHTWNQKLEHHAHVYARVPGADPRFREYVAG